MMSRIKTLLVKLDKPPGGPSHLSYSEPIGICYIGAFLQQHGFDCRLCHLFQESSETALRDAIADYKPDIVGLSIRNFNLGMSHQCIGMIRREFPAIRIAVGGECVTAQHFNELTRFIEADVFMIGDGEASMLAYASGASPANIPGVAYRSDGGAYLFSGKPSLSIPTQRLPMMLRDGLPMERYCSEGFPEMRYATMHALRGCRYRCTFCHTAGRYAELNSRTVEQILEEVDLLTDSFGVEALVIWDEDFFADHDRVRRISEGLVSRGSPVEWHSFMKLTDLRRQPVQTMLPLLRRSGYVRAVIGLESFLPETLRSYHKAGGRNVEELCLQLTQNGIRLCPAYIIGAPHETYEDVRYGLERLLRLRDDHGIQMDLPFVQFITPYPGTALFDEYARQGLIVDPDWSHYDGEHAVVKCQCPPEKLFELRDSFYETFYGQLEPRRAAAPVRF